MSLLQLLIIKCILMGIAAFNSTVVVPSVVHHTYDYQAPSFFLFMSLLTARHFLQPSRHFLWVNDEGRFRRTHWEGWIDRAAKGSWEGELARLIKEGKIEAKLMPFPNHPPGNSSINVQNKAHKSDFLRFNILSEHGGIYLDTDAFVTKSMDELRVHDFSIGFDNVINPNHNAKNALRLNNGVMLSAKNAPFLGLWAKAYYNFDPSSFDYHSSVVPLKLATQYPDLVHVEMNRLSPISYGLQTSEVAAALTCGLFIQSKGGIWYPTATPGTSKYVFPTEPDIYMLRRLDSKLVLHLTMSQVRGTAMLRKMLGPQELEKMPSYLGKLFRTVWQGDNYNYSRLMTMYEQKDINGALKLWNECRTCLGMHTPISKTKASSDASQRQQYVTGHIPH